MVAIALAGSFTAILILAAIGYLHGAGIVATWMAGSVKASIAITLTFGIFLTVVEGMRRQLDDARMALRTKERDEAEARRLAAEAQLASIESRVQPHFLFNTLNSIAALVHHDPAGAERMTGQLAALLRSALDSTATPIVPLDDELKVVRAYLDIERVRFGDRLRYSVDVVDGAVSLMVPRMALQTLVENSVKYAVSPRRDGASIRVRAVVADDRLRLSVEDDGPGFDAATRPAGHGLDLLYRRLKMLFGDTASLTVACEHARTAVCIEVPREARLKADTAEPQAPSPTAHARV
jgi:LytS/YehU family sensor histidine kinase